MVHYIVMVRAKAGHEAQVAQFYQGLEPALRAAAGYRGRQILRARHGALAHEVLKAGPPKEAGHGGHTPPEGVQFVVVEQWESVDDRMAFSKASSGNRGRDLFPYILPEHSHEFYEDVTTA